jgi:parvulin-like peptidyl-prolyl isomerase
MAQTEDPHAVVNGKPVALSDLQGLAGALPPQLRDKPVEVFRYYGFLDRMAEKAEESQLAEQSPYKEQLALQRKQVMAQAAMDQFYKNTVIPEDELKKYYEDHKADFATANVQTLLVPLKSKETAGKLAARLKSGSSVAELLLQYPAVMPTVRKSDARLDPAVRTAVFNLKPGEVSAPIAQPNGVYIFRLQSIETPEYQGLRGEIWRTMANVRFAAWMEEMRKSVTVTR